MILCPTIIKHMHLYIYPGLATCSIVTHAQFSKLNELKWRQWICSRILHNDNFRILAKAHSQDTVLFFGILKYHSFRDNPSDKKLP